MRRYLQETDSTIGIGLPTQVRYTPAAELANVTFGGMIPQAWIEDQGVRIIAEAFTHTLSSNIEELSGWDLQSKYLPMLTKSNPLRSAWDLTYKLENEDLAQYSKNLLSIIQNTLYTFQQLRLDVNGIPRLHAFLAEDDSLLFEWIFNDYRIGFSIESNPQESSWFLVTNKNLGEINASGYIHGLNTRTLILWLLIFILSHT